MAAFDISVKRRKTNVIDRCERVKELCEEVGVESESAKPDGKI
jgi:hypothetical protein